MFEASTIEAIRSKYEEKTSLEGEKRPSRVEALSSFIWGRYLAATSEEYSAKPDKVYLVIHPVNFRRKFDPLLPEHSFGNFYRCSYALMLPSSTLSSHGEEHYAGYEMLKQIREGFKKIDMDYLRKLQQGVDLNLEILKEGAKESFMKGEQVIMITFTSLCGFPIYDADFGWGKPTLVSSASLTFDNLVAFMDTKTGNGIEAYIGLNEEYMAKLENDKEFLKAVSPL